MKKSKIPWRRSQQETIQEIGGEEVPGGGVAPGYGGDGRIRDNHRRSTHLIEHKSSIKDALPIKEKWLQKLLKEATLAGLEPVFTCELGDGSRYKATVEGVGSYFAHHNISIILRPTSAFPFFTSFDGKILWKFERI